MRGREPEAKDRIKNSWSSQELSAKRENELKKELNLLKRRWSIEQTDVWC